MTLLLDEPLPTTDHDVANRISADEGPRWGRRILIGFGVFTLLLGVFVTAVAAPHLDDGVGDRSYHPTAFVDVDHHYSFGIGTLDVDLRDVDFPPGVHHVTVEHGIGSARVWLPADVDYYVSADLEVGELDVLGQTTDGFGNELGVLADSDDTTIVIVDLEVDIGYGRVRQG